MAVEDHYDHAGAVLAVCNPLVGLAARLLDIVQREQRPTWSGRR